jgi:hypothetical protein
MDPSAVSPCGTPGLGLESSVSGPDNSLLILRTTASAGPGVALGGSAIEVAAKPASAAVIRDRQGVMAISGNLSWREERAVQRRDDLRIWAIRCPQSNRSQRALSWACAETKGQSGARAQGCGGPCCGPAWRGDKQDQPAGAAGRRGEAVLRCAPERRVPRARRPADSNRTGRRRVSSQARSSSRRSRS